MSEPLAPVLEGEAFRMVSAMLEERCGLYFHTGNRDILDAGLERVAAQERVSVAQLLRLLVYPSDDLMQRVVQAVTIGETYFFRHPEQFAILGDQVVPQLLRSGRKRLRAWSAGCSTGEEAYSLAMVLYTYAPGIEVQVVGSDINEAALKVAERARYGRHSLRVPSLLLEAYLTSPAPDEFEVIPAIRKLVSFRPLNLRDPAFPSQFAGSEGFDVIFCRNVLLYFAPSLVGQVLGRLRDCLSEGGYLCVSALDYMVQIAGLEIVTFNNVPLLRRTVSPPARPQSPWPTPSRLTPSTPNATSRLTPGAPRRPTPPLVAAAGERPPPSSATEAMAAAKAAADQGRLDAAAAIARDALNHRRSPEALHLLALILGEQGQSAEMEKLLMEAVATTPGYVLGHLSLGLMERPLGNRWQSAHHLHTVMELLRGRRDDEVLTGPESLQVAMARRLARAGLDNLERRP